MSAAQGAKKPPARKATRPPLFAIDSMVLIYHFEDDATFGPAAAALLRAAEEGRCRLLISVLGRLEVLVVPKRRGQHDLCRQYCEVFESFPNLEVASIDVAVADTASDLRATHTLRTPDALHLATAVEHRADAFVTEDGRHFPSGAEGVPILSIQAALARIGE